jgi:hypothetical protein
LISQDDLGFLLRLVQNPAGDSQNYLEVSLSHGAPPTRTRQV